MRGRIETHRSGLKPSAHSGTHEHLKTNDGRVGHEPDLVTGPRSQNRTVALASEVVGVPVSSVATLSMTGASHYLLVLYIKEQQQTPPIPPGEVADTVGKSPAAATEMLQRLDSQGLVSHEPYDGATLTCDGRETATDLHERYVTLSWFFRDVLGLETYEREAMQLAGAVSADVTERLTSLLLSETELE